MNMISQRTALFAIGYGLLIWFEATLMIRWFGDWVFQPDNLQVTIGLFVGTLLVVYSVGWFFFWSFKTPREERAAAAILICAIGLVANAAVLGASAQVFPAFTLAQHQLFASWVAWAYGTGLLSGLWPRKMPLLPAA